MLLCIYSYLLLFYFFWIVINRVKGLLAGESFLGLYAS